MRHPLLVFFMTAAALTAGCGGVSDDNDRAPHGAASEGTSTSVTAEAVAPSGGVGQPPDEPGLDRAAEVGTTGHPLRDGSTTTIPISSNASRDGEPSRPSGVTLRPPAGTYRYDTTGFSETGSGVTTRRREMPQTTVDTVSDVDANRVSVTTSYGDGSEQSTLLEVTPDEVRLERLTVASTSNGIRSEQSITPAPPIVLVRSPYRVGDRWESTWSDTALGVQGIGTGEIVRREAVSTYNEFDSVVVHVDHRLRGSVTGRLQVTLWIDPASAMRARDEMILDMTAAGAPSHYESRRVLRSYQ